MSLDPWLRWVFATLSVWRITHLLAFEDGPFDAVLRLRRILGASVLGRLLECPFCLSLWVAAPFAVVLAGAPVDRFLVWLGLSGATCLLERVTAAPVVITPMPDKEKTDELLR